MGRKKRFSEPPSSQSVTTGSYYGLPFFAVSLRYCGASASITENKKLNTPYRFVHGPQESANLTSQTRTLIAPIKKTESKTKASQLRPNHQRATNEVCVRKLTTKLDSLKVLRDTSVSLAPSHCRHARRGIQLGGPLDTHPRM